MKTKLLALIMAVCLLSGLMLSGCGIVSGVLNNEQEEENKIGYAVYSIIRDENVGLLYMYPTQIIFMGDGTGKYYRLDGSGIVFDCTIDENGYVKTHNTAFESMGSSTPILGEEYPNISGYMEGDIYTLEEAPLRYEKKT